MLRGIVGVLGAAPDNDTETLCTQYREITSFPLIQSGLSGNALLKGVNPIPHKGNKLTKSQKMRTQRSVQQMTQSG